MQLHIEKLQLMIDGQPLIRGIDLDLDLGELTVVLGPNGAGKSLFLRLCHGLIQPTSGVVRWNGQRPRQTMVFQKPVMLRRTALQNVLYVLGQNNPENMEAAHSALAWAQIEYLAHRQAAVLSGGEQQLLAIARARAMKPEVLFLDEPTASLDPVTHDRVEQLIASAHAAGTRIIMTTHNLAQARRLAESIVFLDKGQVLAQQGREAFFDTPACDAAAEFLKRESGL